MTRVLLVEDEPLTVRTLRLEHDAGRPRHLVTEPGMGYRFEP